MLKSFPKDLALVIFFTLLCIPFVVIPPLTETPIRIILGLPFLLFLPGYSLIAILYPKKDDLGVIERVTLSFGLSIATVPLLSLALNYTTFGIRLPSVLIVLSVFTISLAIGAWVRRSRLPERNRFVVEFRSFFKSIELFKAYDTKIDRALTVIIIILIVLAIFMTVYVIITPKIGEKFTEFYVLGPSGKAEGYPTNLEVGEEGEMMVGIVNREYANATYQLRTRLNGELIDKKSIELAHNETWMQPFTFRATKAGEDQKLEFLLFKYPFNKSVYKPFEKSFIKNASQKTIHEEPYRALHLWVDVKG